MTNLRRPGPLSERLGSLRVGYLGVDAADAWLGSRVRRVEIDSDWEPAVEAEHWIDILVVGCDTDDWADTDTRRIVNDARAVDIRTVGFLSERSDAALSGLVDITIAPTADPGSGADVQLPQLVDLDRVSPLGGVPRIGTGPLLAFRSRRRRPGRGTHRSVARLLAEAAAGRIGAPRTLVMEDLAHPPDIRSRMDTLRNAWGVVDHDSLHASERTRAQFLAQLSIAGIPFRLLDESPDALDTFIGTDLREAASGPVNDLFDPDERERISVGQRRIALRRFTDWGRWEEIARLLDLPMRANPLVSAIVATNRPEQLEHILHQINLQSYQPVEPVFVLHGDGFGDEATRLITARCPGALSIRIDESRSLGEALNAGVELAGGDLVTKMDDDDWYGVEHVWDLVHAMEYSGAELVGKAAEWVYLAELDLTMRRFATGAESDSATLAGGTMMMRRSDILSVGGFRRARRHVDLGLIEDVKRFGGRTYRTHGSGYLLNRRSTGHTWDIGVDYFLEQSTTQIRGLSCRAPLLPAGCSPASANSGNDS